MSIEDGAMAGWTLDYPVAMGTPHGADLTATRVSGG